MNDLSKLTRQHYEKNQAGASLEHPLTDGAGEVLGFSVGHG
jgi:hypothetical protein